MFGYLQIQKSELLVREYEAYKSVYCGLCRQMGRDYSFLARFSLSYDCTFYAMLLMALSKSCSGFKDGRCTFNPLKKCKFAICEDDCFSKASAFSVLSVYYKLKDDMKDERFFKRLFIRMMFPFFSHWRNKALKKYSEVDNYLSQMTNLQSKTESDPEFTVDAAAHPTALMLSNLFALEASGDADKRILREFGYQLGRWIYLIDAADDYEKDIKNGNFNPYKSLKIDCEEQPIKIISSLNQSLARAYDAYNLTDFKDFRGIFDNMLTLGLPSVQNKITAKFKGGHNE